MNNQFCVAIEHNYLPEDTISLYDIVKKARDNGHDVAAVNIVNPKYARALKDINEIGPFKRDDIVVQTTGWAKYIIGKISEFLDFDSTDATIRVNSELILKQETSWAGHLGLTALLFPTLPKQLINYARCLNNCISSVPYAHIIIRIPLEIPDIWDRWNTLRNLCSHNSRIKIALEIPGDLPEGASLDRWFSEPIASVIVPKKIFLTNKNGYPVLSKRHQELVRKLFKHTSQFIISDIFNEPLEKNGLPSYQQYLRHLYRTQEQPSEIEKLAIDYEDYLQTPLQPLMDNLESMTYEVFEQDPVKYIQYEEAIYRALLDRMDFKKDEPLVVMVVGAGRGPIVERALRASERANRKIKLYAIEKNPNAFITLKQKKEVWGDKVTIVFTDMRYWDAPEKADILVSELLGSFGDNELSPECLDGAQKLLNPETGISIPSDYTSYITPISSTKLYNSVSSYKDIIHFETSYVVKFNKVCEISEPKPIWSFHHPNWNIDTNPGSVNFNLHNDRYNFVEFTIPENMTIHGIGGYFEATLYKDVIISINPPTHSKGMFSWFPLFFPLKIPMYAKKDTKVVAHFWRLHDTKKVWYEWCVVPVTTNNEETVPQDVGSASSIHNPGGRSHWIGL
jgi:protein arginine N-methyltransferase 5